MTQGLYIWSKSAASNNNADTSINWSEGQAPSSVNDSARAMMARTAEYRDDVSGSLTTGGTSTAFTVTTNEVFDSLAHMDKMTLTIVPHTTSGASPTLAVDGLTAKLIRQSTGISVATGALLQGTPYRLTYYNSAGEFIVDGCVPSGIQGSQIASNTVANSNLSNVAAWTLKGNNSGSSAAPQDFTIDALTAKASPLAADEVPIWDAAGSAMKKATFTAISALIISTITAPTVQSFTSGSGTYTSPAGIARIRVRMGAGGGNAGGGTAGGNSSFGTWTAVGGGAGGGTGGTGGAGGSGGTNGTGTLIARFNGGSGGSGGTGGGDNFGGSGGGTYFGGTGSPSNGVSIGAPANSGIGGCGTASGGTGNGGGGGGEVVEFWMTAAQVGASLSYTVGAGGTGGTGQGAAGRIIVEEFYI